MRMLKNSCTFHYQVLINVFPKGFLVPRGLPFSFPTSGRVILNRIDLAVVQIPEGLLRITELLRILFQLFIGQTGKIFGTAVAKKG